MQKKIAIISPAYPSAINGLGDYAQTLGESFRNTFSQTTIQYWGLPQIENVTIDDYTCISHFLNGILLSLVKTQGISSLLINYSNYGYQVKGVPFWLLREIKILSKHQIPVYTFFHEIYAIGKPWQSSFWLHPLQKIIFKKIYKYSNAVFCSNNRVLDLIKENTSDRGYKVKNIGLFSNIPEPETRIDFYKRNSVAVVFGTFMRRQAVYNKLDKIIEVLISNGIKMIYDIGAGDIQFEHKTAQKIQVKKLGKLPKVEIAAYLSIAKIGLIEYPNSLLGKSGIFAAYAAHGLAVINLGLADALEIDHLKSGLHFVNEVNKHQLNSIENAMHLYDWYQSRNLNCHTKEIGSKLFG